MFIQDLKLRDKVEIKHVSHDDIVIEKYKEYFYDNIILLCPSHGIIFK